MMLTESKHLLNEEDDEENEWGMETSDKTRG
jgi:hypothetical protein